MKVTSWCPPEGCYASCLDEEKVKLLIMKLKMASYEKELCSFSLRLPLTFKKAQQASWQKGMAETMMTNYL